MRLYRLAMHVSLVAGPLSLIEGDFPNPEWMREIAESNLRQGAGARGTMIGVHETLVVLAVLVLTVGAVFSVAAITIGWIAPGPGAGQGAAAPGVGLRHPGRHGRDRHVPVRSARSQGPGTAHFPVSMSGMAVFAAEAVTPGSRP